MDEMTVTGLDELKGELELAVHKYPDMAEISLKKMGNRLKREVVKQTRAVVKEHSKKLVKGYKVGRVQGYGMGMYVEFSGTAPHFHLVENGHKLIGPNGEDKGYVQGKHMVATVAASYDSTMGVELEKMTDTILRVCSLS